MPGFQLLQPLFWSGAALGFFGSIALTAHFRLSPAWMCLVLSYLAGLFSGLRFVDLFLRWRPDARFATRDKIDGMGYVWINADVVVPYFILGILMGFFMLLRHLF